MLLYTAFDIARNFNNDLCHVNIVTKESFCELCKSLLKKKSVDKTECFLRYQAIVLSS